MRISLLAVLIALVSATMGFATTQDVYENLWSKRAIRSGDSATWLKPKGTCVCQDGGVNHARLGVLTRVGLNSAVCGFPGFDGNGNIFSLITTCLTFEYIGK